MTPDLLEIILNRLDTIEESVGEIKEKLFEKIGPIETNVALIKNKQGTHLRECSKRHSWAKKMWISILTMMTGGIGMLFVQWIVTRIG